VATPTVRPTGSTKKVSSGIAFCLIALCSIARPIELDSAATTGSPHDGKPVYHWPLDGAAHQRSKRFAELTDDMPGESATLVVQERALIVPRAARNVAWFQFDELCAAARRRRLPRHRRALRAVILEASRASTRASATRPGAFTS